MRQLPDISIIQVKVHVYVEDNHPTIIKLMYKNAHGHKQRHTKTGTASPVPELMSDFFKSVLHCFLNNF